MLLVIGSRNSCEQSSNHFDDICHWHRTDLVLRSSIRSSMSDVRPVEHFLAGKALDMRQISNLDPARGRSLRATQRPCGPVRRL